MVIKDISSRADIQLLVDQFYQRVIADPTIGIIFTEVIPMNWQHHIPLIVDFWETILLDNPLYKNNAMEKHFEVNQKFPLKKEHFEAWLALFNITLNENFAGPVTELAKKRAASIAGLIQFKINLLK